MRLYKPAQQIFQRRTKTYIWALLICVSILLVKISYAKTGASDTNGEVPVSSKELTTTRHHIKRFLKAAAAFTKSKQQIRELRSTNLVLITTLDGDLHGVDRYNGQILWSLEGVAGGPLIRTSATNHHQSLVDEEYSSDTQVSKLQEEDLDQVTYIVEPTNDGILYMFSPKLGLQKFPFSIKQLVNLSPFRSVDGKVFVGSKTTKFFAVDPRTGKMLQSFDSEGDDECPSVGALPKDALYLGKNAYKISIFDGKSKKPIWNVTYSEYVPNSLDVDVEINYKTSPDGLYIASTHTGEILSTDSENGQHVWYQKFDSPAINVFDVLATSDLSNDLHIARQPQPPNKYYKQINRLSPSPATSAYIDRIEDGDSLFVMSAENFPMTRFMRMSKWAGISSPATKYDHYRLNGESELTEDNEKEYCHPRSKTFLDCLIGNHILSPTDRRLLDPDSSIPSHVNSVTFRYIDIPKPRTLFQAGLSWVIILLFVGFVLYWNRRQQNGGRVTFIGRVITKFTSKFTKRKQNKYGILDSTGVENVISFKSKKSKKKDRSKGATNNINTKKQDIKDEDQEKAISSNIASKEVIPNTDSVSRTVTFNPNANAVSMVNSDQAINILTPTNTTNTIPIITNSSTSTITPNHGTIVYKGTFEGRDVAVKRLLLDFYDIAHHEVSLLQESDDHSNVIRYYCKEQCDRFLYIALELCPASLYDVIEKGSSFRYAELLETLNPPKILYQIVSGLHHLHSMKIVHRDIKPQNILIASSKYKRIIKKDGGGSNSNGVPMQQPCVARVLISDFGLCKKLEGDTSSFHNTTNNAGGTIGWRAPELLSPLLPTTSTEDEAPTNDPWVSVDRLNDNSFTSSSGSDHGGNNNGQPRRVTKAIDIFSAGCLFYYVLSGGEHPFGDRYSREVNILKGVYELNKLDDMGEACVEARDLIERMIERDPKKRPRASTVMIHPYFWAPSKRLSFLQDASDRFEIEERDPPSPLLQRLETDVVSVIGPDWYRRIDRVLVDNLGKYRKYDGSRIRDLLRALRNKKHHYQDLPEHVKKSLGEVPEGFLFYFTSRFPKLLLHVYYVISENESLRNESMFRHYFEIPGEM
ncbi:7024_t:CDS:2 [Ambispora gerdemannii]|uniref:non-specific serine/threonine protein kinase n=1 Tax=Ambispora gerdemannii TaxID=144530 RepID=A0A9N8W6L1_9GLOM|nr:7024_t:CDS:2 [Ambispora gerdemannii]